MTRHAVILDTDPGVDDALALLYLHRHASVDLVGVTTVFGNAPIELTTRNALFLKESFGFPAPVARGAGACLDPSRQARGYPTSIHGENGLGNVAVREPAVAPDPRPAHRFIVDLLRARPGEIALVAVGRLTNLALALGEAPEIAGLAKEVVVMGGAFATHGNVSPAAEANVHGDPEAADLVLGASWPVRVVGLDATHAVTMTRAALDALAEAGGPAARLVRDLSQDYVRFYETRIPDGMIVHDATACVALTDPALFETRRGAIRVVCGGIADGATIQAPDDFRFSPGPWSGRPSQEACLGVDAAGVLGAIRGAIAGD